MCGSKWNRNDEPAASIKFAFDADSAAVQLHQLLHQGESDSASLIGTTIRPLHSMKSLEQPRNFIGRDARASVPHAHLDVCAGAAHCDLDLAGKRELECVGEEIEDNLLPHLAIHVYRFGERRTIDDQPQSGAFDCGAEHAGEFRRQLRQIGGFIRGLHASGFNAGEVEQGIDELEQPQGIALRELQAFAVSRETNLPVRQAHLQAAPSSGSEGCGIRG